MWLALVLLSKDALMLPRLQITSDGPLIIFSCPNYVMT
jgi:hypothetical protein